MKEAGRRESEGRGYLAGKGNPKLWIDGSVLTNTGKGQNVGHNGWASCTGWLEVQVYHLVRTRL